MCSAARTLGTLIALGLVLAVSATAQAVTFGANVGTLFRPDQTSTAATLDVLRSLRDIGATVARSDTLWQNAEMKPPVGGVHTYDWTYDDGVASTLSQAGLRWQPIVDYAAPWAADSNGGDNPGVAPGHIGDYAAYAGALAVRYGVGGTFWAEHPEVSPKPVNVFEIWNEEDLLEYWGPEPDLAEYATMFLQARAAMKSVDPTAKVIIGGLVWPDPSLSALVAARPDLRGNVDGVAVHPYHPDAASTLAAVADDLHSDAATVGAPLYVNEFGWQVGGPGAWQGVVSEASRDSDMTEITAQLGTDPYVADVEPYCWSGCSSFTLYGTSAATGFAAGIAAANTAAANASAQPTIEGAPLPGRRLTCSTAGWTGGPISYAYQWNQNGTPILHARANSYTVEIADKAQTLTCQVTATEAGGVSRQATSTPAIVALPGTLNCPRPTGRLGAPRFGPVSLGMSRSLARQVLRRYTTRHGFDDYCLYGGWGIRAAYLSDKLPSPTSRVRRNVSLRMVGALTANPYFALKGVRPGTPLLAAANYVRTGKVLHIGRNDWYVLRAGAANDLLMVRAGVVQEIGIADKRLTRGRRAQFRFLTSFK